MAKRHTMSVSGSTFARLCGVTRQAIHEAAKKDKIIKDGKLFSLENPKNRAFLIDHDGKIDDYLADPVKHEEDIIDEAKNRQREELKRKLKQQDLPEDISRDEIAKLLMIERRKKLQIENEIMMNNLVEKKLVKAVLGHIGQAIKIHFVDYPRRESVLLAAELAAPGKEKQIENFLVKGIGNALEAMKEEVARLSRDEIYT